jgi:hypothetical protein
VHFANCNMESLEYLVVLMVLNVNGMVRWLVGLARTNP